MQFMIIVRANKDTEAGMMPEDKLVADMAAYHEELMKAGVLLDASGLQPSSKGARIRYSGGKRTVIDGPFAEAKELIAGYTIIQVKSREEAMEWARQFPNPMGEGADGEIEIRQLYELEDFPRARGSTTSARWRSEGRSRTRVPHAMQRQALHRRRDAAPRTHVNIWGCAQSLSTTTIQNQRTSHDAFHDDLQACRH